MGGRLYVQGVSERSPWNPTQLVYYSEEIVDKIMQTLAGDRKVQTAQDLAEVIRLSERGLPTVRICILQGLEELVRKYSRPGGLEDHCSEAHLDLRDHRPTPG